jgi:predicted transcriptional regulator
VNGNVSVSELVDKHIMQKDDHAFPVLEEDQLVGLVTLQDVRGVNKGDWGDVLVKEIMTPRGELVTVTRDEDASDAFTKLSRKSVRQLPVCEGDEIVGLLRREEIVKWLKIHANSVMGNLMSISASMNRKFSNMNGEENEEKS